MATWQEFADVRPDMADVLLKLFETGPLAYLATIRRDGSPRVHPVSPILAGGRLFVAVNERSPKRLDLARDGRYAMHALPGERDDEFYVTGRARRHTDEATRDLVRQAAGHTIRDSDWLFEFDLERAMTAYLEHVGQPGTYAVRQLWRDER